MSFGDEGMCICVCVQLMNIHVLTDPTNTAKGFVGTSARYKTVTVHGQKVKLKWCATCNIWRPPRATHCGLCNNCYGE